MRQSRTTRRRLWRVTERPDCRGVPRGAAWGRGERMRALCCSRGAKQAAATVGQIALQGLEERDQGCLVRFAEGERLHLAIEVCVGVAAAHVEGDDVFQSL